MSLRSFKLCSFLILLGTALFSGCKKDNATQSTTPVSYDFSYTGTLYFGNVIRFTTTVAASNKFLWSFGDGTTATTAMPDHTFKNPGVYNVSLLINNDTLDTISKKISIGFDAGIMASLIGTRLYSNDYIKTDANISSHYVDPDTMITIKEIDPATISFGETVLYCNSFENGSVTFSWTNPSIPYYFDQSDLTYNTLNKEISYVHYIQASGHLSYRIYYNSK